MMTATVENVGPQENDVDKAIGDAGGDSREAIRRLLMEVDQLYRALAWADKSSSIGYRRLRQPERQA